MVLDEAGRGVGGGVMRGMGRVQPSLLQISTMMESHSPCTRQSIDETKHAVAVQVGRVVDGYLEEVVELVGFAHELSVDQDLWYFRVGIAHFLCRAAPTSTHALARLATVPPATGRSERRTRDDRHRLYAQRGAHNHQQVDLVQILVQREIEPGNRQRFSIDQLDAKGAGGRVLLGEWLVEEDDVWLHHIFVDATLGALGYLVGQHLVPNQQSKVSQKMSRKIGI